MHEHLDYVLSSVKEIALQDAAFNQKSLSEPGRKAVH
jgi:hypothetical protein